MRSVVALLLTCCISTLAGATPEVRDLRADPNPFSPDFQPPADRDSTWIHYRISEPADSVRVQIAGIGTPLFTLATHAPAGAGAYADPWDGRDAGGAQLADGEYLVRVDLFLDGALIDQAGSGVVIDTEAPRLQPAPPLPLSPLSPDGDGYADRLWIGFRVDRARPGDDLTSGFISDLGGARIAPLRFADGGSGKYGPITLDSLSWQGETESPPLAEGLYRWRIESVDRAGNRDAIEGSVRVDLLPPRIEVDPAFPQGLRFSNPDTLFVLAGSAEDTLSAVTAIELALEGGSGWTAVADSIAPRVAFSAGFAFTPLHGDGTYHFLARARDGQNHTNSGDGPRPLGRYTVILDTAPPLHLATAATHPELRDDDLLTLESTWSEDSLALEVDLSPLDPGYLPGSASITAQGGGIYTISYPLPPASGIDEVRDAAIAITARDGANPPVRAAAAVLLTLDNRPPRIWSSTLLGSPTVANGDSVEIEIRTDGAGYSVAVDFSTIDSGFAPGDETVGALNDTLYHVGYRISAGNTLGDRARVQLPIEVRDRAGNASPATGPELTLLNGSSGDFLEASLAPAVVDTERDSLRIQLTLARAAPSASLAIHGNAGLVRELFSGALPAAPHSFTWDGRDESGAQATDGSYLLKIEAVAEDATIARRELSFRVDTIAPRLAEFFFEPSSGVFAPDGDLVGDTLRVGATVVAGDSAATHTVAEILTTTGALVQRLSPTNQSGPEFAGGGAAQWRWSGEGAATDGPYRLRVRTWDDVLDGVTARPLHTDSLAAPLEVDRNGPLILPTADDSTAYAQLPLLVSGIAVDPAGVRGVEYRLNPRSPWLPATTANPSDPADPTPADTLAWSFTIEGQPGATLHAWIRGRDGFGHVTGETGPLEAAHLLFLFDAAGPKILRVGSDRQTYEVGDTLLVDVETDDPNATLRLDLSRLDSAFDSTRVVTTHRPGELDFYLSYVLDPNNDRASGDYPVLVYASDGLHPATLDSSLVVRFEQQEIRVVAIPARWDRGDAIRITADSPRLVTVQIYNLAADLIWSYRSPAPRAVMNIPWDRRNLRGEAVRSGAYLCRVTLRDVATGAERTWVKPTVMVRE